jgi:hypothetical protein
LLVLEVKPLHGNYPDTRHTRKACGSLRKVHENSSLLNIHPEMIRKKRIYFLVITELSLFRTPDNKTHNDTENPPDHEVGTEEKDEK